MIESKSCRQAHTQAARGKDFLEMTKMHAYACAYAYRIKFLIY